jgi:hypothetical protein
MRGDLLDDIEDLLDPTTAEGITFIAGSGFLDDDDQEDADGTPCSCWCGCRRGTGWPDDTCTRCQHDRHLVDK